MDETLWEPVNKKLNNAGVDIHKPWLIIHAGVSEKKREYPITKWAEAARKLIDEKDYQIILTGSSAEKRLTDELAGLIGKGSFSAGGLFDLGEYIRLVRQAQVMLSVNTGTVHIAAAVVTPVIVLYAQTNPQHTPWNVANRVLQFPVAEGLRSKNEVIAYVNNTLYTEPIATPSADDILNAVDDVLNSRGLLTQSFREILNENQEPAAN